MSTFLARKQEESYQKQVRDLLRLPENKKCFDCPTKGPAYVDTTIQTFVCARCSGLVREAGHRVKSVSASKFSGPETLALKMGGNGVAQKIWLSNYSTLNSPEPESDDDVRAFMRQKYYENKWLDRNLLFTHNQQIRHLISQSFTDDGQPIKPNTRAPHIITASTSTTQQQLQQPVPTNSFSQPMQLPKFTSIPAATISFEKKRASIDSQRSSISSSSEKYPASIYSNRSSVEHPRDNSPSLGSNSNRQSVDSARFSSYQGSTGTAETSDHTLAMNNSIILESQQIRAQDVPQMMHVSIPIEQEAPKLSKLVNYNNNIQATSSASISVTPVDSKPRPISATSGAFDSIISELAGLKMEKTVKRATYTGGILSPSSTVAPLTPTSKTESKESLFDEDFFSKFNPAKKNEVSDDDQYAALRGIPTPVAANNAPVVNTKEEEKHTSSSEDDDEEDWQDFCSSSNFEESNTEVEAQPVVEKTEIIEEPVVVIDFFSDLDPRSMFKRF